MGEGRRSIPRMLEVGAHGGLVAEVVGEEVGAAHGFEAGGAVLVGLGLGDVGGIDLGIVEEAGVAGAGLLLVARRVVGVEFVDDADSPPVPVAPTDALLRTELPFGPFLAAAAVVFLYAEPWLSVHLRLPGR